MYDIETILTWAWHNFSLSLFSLIYDLCLMLHAPCCMSYALYLLFSALCSLLHGFLHDFVWVSKGCSKMMKCQKLMFSQTLKVEENKVSLFLSIFAQELRFSLFLLFCQPRQQGAILKFRKWLYLSPWAKIEKTRGYLFSQTLKVEENKVSLVFSIFAQGPRYGHFLNLQV